MLKVREAIEVMKRNSIIIKKKIIIKELNKENPFSMESSAPSHFNPNLYFKLFRNLNQTNFDSFRKIKDNYFFRENLFPKAPKCFI